MLNTEQVIDFFRNHIECVLKEQDPYTWCDDDKNRELLWEIEQEISDFNNEHEGEENYEQDFESQHVDTYDEAEDLVKELNRRLEDKWNFAFPFIVTHNARANAFEDLLILAWDVTYILETDIGRFFVQVKIKGHEIKIAIDNKIIGMHKVADHNFDSHKDLEQKRLIFNLTQKG